MHFRAFTGCLRHDPQRPTTSAAAFPGGPTFCQFWDSAYCYLYNLVPVCACNIDVNLVRATHVPGQQSGLRSNFIFAHPHGTTYHCFSSASQWSMRRTYVFNAFIILFLHFYVDYSPLQQLSSPASVHSGSSAGGGYCATSETIGMFAGSLLRPRGPGPHSGRARIWIFTTGGYDRQMSPVTRPYVTFGD